MAAAKSEKLSDYWLVNHKPDLNSLFDLMKLQNAVANFVKIVSGRDISVEFKVKDEKSTKDKIIISADLSNIDATVGLAVHETVSFLYSPGWIISRLITLVNDDYVNRYINRFNTNDSTLNSNLPASSSIRNRIKNRFVAEMKNMYYLIEYWRLDDLAVRTSPGYKGYIAASYRQFFNPDETAQLLITQIRTEMILKNPVRKYTYKQFVLTYEHLIYALFAQSNHAVNYQNSCTVSLENLTPEEKNTETYAVYEHLKSLIDINNISRLKNSEDTLNFTVSVWETMTKVHNDPRTNYVWEAGDARNLFAFENPDLEKTATNVMQAASLEMEKKSISVAHKEELKTFSNNSSDKNYTHYDNRRIEVIVLKELNRSLIYSGKHHFFDTQNTYHTENAVLEGIRLGNQLAQRILFRNNERQTHFSRLPQGKIDKRLLHSVVCGNDCIFYRKQEETFPAVNFHISIDGSHSMQGSSFLKCIQTAVAIAQACFLIKNIHVTISFRYHVEKQGAKLPLLLIAYDSKRDKIAKIKQLFPFLKATGSTPEGLCYPVITDWIEKESGENSENYFVNFYDGMPCFIIDEQCCYEGQTAMEHVRSEVLRMKRKGIRVLSYFIISRTWKMEEVKKTFVDCQYMYGKDAKMINISALGELAQSLNNLVAKTSTCN